mmetsp:Transcript_10550/g.15425  ORF Transcript_10550/g.15425 Transcript_10550/m.15425 type:complete len:445 (+) Transcript_10550:51-1385(+)
MNKIYIFAILICFFVLTIKAQIEDDPNLDKEETSDLERCFRTSNDEETRNLYCEAWVPKLDKELGHLPRYCNGNGLCVKRTNRTYEQTKADDLNQEAEYCFDGFHPASGLAGTGSKCFSVANYGCVIPDGQTNYRRCASGSTRNAQDNSCQPPEAPAASSEKVGLGKDCGINNNAENPLPIECDFNLRCNSQRKCVHKSAVGEYCASNTECKDGLLCSSNQCIRYHSLEWGQPCDATSSIGDLSCKTGYCGRDARCTHTSTQRACIKDADCNTNYVSSIGRSRADNTHSDATPVQDHTVCVISGKYEAGKYGWCSAYYQPAVADLQNCVYSNCFAPAGDGNYNAKCNSDYASGMDQEHPCIKEYVRAQCAKNCAKGYDRRLDSSIRYTFDCDDKVLSATPWSPTQCEIKEQFKNCEYMVWYPSSASSLSTSFVLLLSFVLFMLF